MCRNATQGREEHPNSVGTDCGNRHQTVAPYKHVSERLHPAFVVNTECIQCPCRTDECTKKKTEGNVPKYSLSHGSILEFCKPPRHLSMALLRKPDQIKIVLILMKRTSLYRLEMGF